MESGQHANAVDPRVLRHRLRETGYCPIPLYGKEPPAYGKNNNRRGLPGWQQLQEVTPEQIDIWARTWPEAFNTGALTRLMPTLDLDILNEDAVCTIEDHVRKHYEERGYILIRIGLPPKRAIPFRTEQPFTKITINLVAPNGSTEKHEKIEFLGEGQQVVVAGIHPDTQQPYSWFGGEPGQVKLEDLPYIHGAEARPAGRRRRRNPRPRFRLHARSGAPEAAKAAAQRQRRRSRGRRRWRCRLAVSVRQHPRRARPSRFIARPCGQADRFRHERGCGGQSITGADGGFDRTPRWALAGSLRRYPASGR